MTKEVLLDWWEKEQSERQERIENLRLLRQANNSKERGEALRRSLNYVERKFISGLSMDYEQKESTMLISDSGDNSSAS